MIQGLFYASPLPACIIIMKQVSNHVISGYLKPRRLNTFVSLSTCTDLTIFIPFNIMRKRKNARSDPIILEYISMYILTCFNYFPDPKS